MADGSDRAGRQARSGVVGSSAGGLVNQVATGATLSADIASVERGWIAPKAGVVNLIWLVILVLMVWQP